MSLAQAFVVSWTQFVLGAALLLLAARLLLPFVQAIADRARLIQFTLLATLALPLVAAFSPLAVWRVSWTISLPASSSDSDIDPLYANRAGEDHGDPSAAAVYRDALERHTEAGDSRGESGVSTNLLARDRPSSTGVSPAPDQTTLASRLTILVGRFNDPWTLAAVGVAGVHAAVALFFLLERLIGWLRLRRLLAAAHPAADELVAMWREVAEGRGERVKLLVSKAAHTPFVCGGWRPTVVLPLTLANGDRISLRYSLAHEWRHIERGDVGWSRVVWACQFLLWPQPLFWMLRRELKLCQELSADAHAARLGDAVEYAELLLKLSHGRGGGRIVGAIAFVDRASQLTRRVKMLLGESKNGSQSGSHWFAAALGAGAILGVTLLGGVRVGVTQAEEPRSPAVAVPIAQAENVEAPSAVASHTVNGVIVASRTGVAIANAVVTVRRWDWRDADHKTLVQETRHTTDAEGKYSFEITREQASLPDLRVGIEANHADYLRTSVFGRDPTKPRAKPSAQPRFFERIALRSSNTITGRLLNPDGSPAAGVRVHGASYRAFGNIVGAVAEDTYPHAEDVVTDADGRFRFKILTSSDACLWAYPKDFAVLERVVPHLGDQGDLRLEPGYRVSGRMLDDQGQPILGFATLQRAGNNPSAPTSRRVVNFLGGESLCRKVSTDSEGRFTFDPLPAGDYVLIPRDEDVERSTGVTTRRPFPGVAVHQLVTISRDAPAAPIEVRTVPYVTIRVKTFDSQGEPQKVKSIFAGGFVNGVLWRGVPNGAYLEIGPEGEVVLRFPQGAQDVQVSPPDHDQVEAYRYRLTSGEAPRNFITSVKLKEVNEDLSDFEFIRYRAPVVRLTVVDEHDRPLDKVNLAGFYRWTGGRAAKPNEWYVSDISILSDEAGRAHTIGLLPDEEATFYANLPGYEPIEETVNLAEGSVHELKLVMRQTLMNKVYKGIYGTLRMVNPPRDEASSVEK